MIVRTVALLLILMRGIAQVAVQPSALQVSREPIADTQPQYTEWQLKWQYFCSLFEWRSFVQHVAFGFLAAFLIYLRVRALVSAAMQPIRRRQM